MFPIAYGIFRYKLTSFILIACHIHAKRIFRFFVTIKLISVSLKPLKDMRREERMKDKHGSCLVGMDLNAFPAEVGGWNTGAEDWIVLEGFGQFSLMEEMEEDLSLMEKTQAKRGIDEL